MRGTHSGIEGVVLIEAVACRSPLTLFVLERRVPLLVVCVLEIAAIVAVGTESMVLVALPEPASWTDDVGETVEPATPSVD